MESIGPKLLANLPLVLLTVGVLVGLTIAYRAWSEAHEDDEPASPEDLLADLENAYYMGEIDADELSRVKELLARPRSVATPERRRVPARRSEPAGSEIPVMDEPAADPDPSSAPEAPHDQS